MRKNQIKPLPFHSPQEAILSVYASLRKQDEQAAQKKGTLKKGPGTLKKARSAEALLQHIETSKNTYFEICDSKLKKATSLDNANFNATQSKRSSLGAIPEEKSIEKSKGKNKKVEDQEDNMQWLSISKLNLGDNVGSSDSDDDNIFQIDDV